MGRASRLLAFVVVSALVGIGIWELRDGTMSTHEPVDPDTRTTVVLEAAQHRSEAGHTLEEMVAAKVLTCRLEVRRSEVVAGPDRLGPADRFRVVLQPGLDATDQVQLRGCLEDWNVDQLLIDVRSMTEPAGG